MRRKLGCVRHFLCYCQIPEIAEGTKVVLGFTVSEDSVRGWLDCFETYSVEGHHSSRHVTEETAHLCGCPSITFKGTSPVTYLLKFLPDPHSEGPTLSTYELTGTT